MRSRSTGDEQAATPAARAGTRRRAVRPCTSGYSSQATATARPAARGADAVALVRRTTVVATVAWLAWELTAAPLGLA